MIYTLRLLSALLIVGLLSVRYAHPTTESKIIHVLVALCDNDSQGIVPVPKKIGNGNNPDNNLYWGCGYGVRSFFKASSEWKTVKTIKNPKSYVLERIIFIHRINGAVLVADAYRGSRIKECTIDFFKNASGNFSEQITYPSGKEEKTLELGNAQMIAYVGHNGLMDFALKNYPTKANDLTYTKDVMIYACISKSYYQDGVKAAGANPLICTTGLMCPEAYTLKATLDGWLLGETGQQIRERAAVAYNTYQKCGMKGARGLFYTGW